jgi:hypothetical protein
MCPTPEWKSAGQLGIRLGVGNSGPAQAVCGVEWSNFDGFDFQIAAEVVDRRRFEIRVEVCGGGMLNFLVSKIDDGFDSCIDPSVVDLERDKSIGFVAFDNARNLWSKTVVVLTLKVGTRDNHLLIVLHLFRDFLAKVVVMNIMAALG